MRELKHRHIDFFRLNTEDIGSNLDVVLDFSAGRYSLSDRAKARTISLSEVSAIYFRRPRLPEFAKLNVSTDERIYLQKEAFYLLEGIYTLLKDRKWISPVNAIRKAENKLYQLQLAKTVGFRVPDTLVTNVPGSLSAFSIHRNCIMKPIKSGYMGPPEKASRMIFTHRLPKEVDLTRVQPMPVLVQNEIIKKFDVRVTVVGRHVFPAAILSQSCAETSVDWRKGNHAELVYKKIQLPAYVAQACVNLTQRLGLKFSAIDLVCDADDGYTFLEINPNGQWAWIQNRLGYNISGALVDSLVED